MLTGENVDVWKHQIETLVGETQNESPHDEAPMKFLGLSTFPSPNTDLDQLTFFFFFSLNSPGVFAQ